MRKIRNLLIFAIAFLSLFLLGANLFKTNAVINENFYFIVTTPGEDASTQISMNWHSKNDGTYLEYTYAEDTEFAKATKVTPVQKIFSTNNEANKTEGDKFNEARFVCSVNLENLEPRTKYIYRVVSGAAYSETYHFTTAGLTNEWKFIAFTDFQNPNNTNTHTIIKKMYDLSGQAPLAVCSGDLTSIAGHQSDFEWMFNSNVWQNFIFASAPGDHEYMSKEGPYAYFSTPLTFNAIFNNPKNGCSEANMINTSYYFYYNNVLFVSLDSDDCNHSTYDTRKQKEVKWFDETLKKLEGTYQYLVVLEHKNIYGSKEEDTGVRKYMTEPWRQVFDKYGVDLVLAGHDHMYSRTYQIYNNKVTTDPKVGTYYLGMSSSGNKYRVPGSDLATDGLHEKVIDMKNANPTYANGALISVTEKGMKVEVYNTLDQKVDEFELVSKREAKEYDFSGYKNDEFKDEISIDIINAAAKSGKVNFLSTQNLKYVKSLKIATEKGSVILDAPVNFNDTKGMSVTGLNSLKYKVYVTLLDGTVQNFDYTIDVGELKNLKVVTDEDGIYIKFVKDVMDIVPNTYKLYADGEFVREIPAEEIKSKQVTLNNNYLIGNHKFKIELYSDGILQKDFEVSNTGYFDIDCDVTEISVNVGEEKDIEYYFEDENLIEVSSSDESVATISDKAVKGVKAGECSITIKVAGTDFKKEIKVTVVSVDKPTKSGCNSGLRLQGSKIDKIMTSLVFGLGMLGLGLGLAFRKKKEN